MEVAHPLKTFLQLQLASDSSAVLHLPYLLTVLTPDCFSPSPHTQKWTARIYSLLHSKDAGSRWAGLCLAYKTSMLSKSMMIECAQSWLAVALPILSKNEPTPTLKAAVRLLGCILTTAIDVPEFQRQVVSPNIPKINLALIAIAENHASIELKCLSLVTLTRLVSLHPTLHRALHANLSALPLKFFHGSVHKPTDPSILEAVSQLFAVLHFTGGKVGAANLWRKSVDDTLANAWSAFLALRTTFQNEGRTRALPQSLSDPLASIPLELDRLRCCIVILCDLLKSQTHRPVQVPIGPLVNFATSLLGCSTEGQSEGYIEPTVQIMEVSVVPVILRFSCDLIVCLSECAQYHISPHVPKIVIYIMSHLEKKPPPSQRIKFLRALRSILSNSYPLHAPLLLGRLMKTVLSSLSIILAVPSEIAQHKDIAAGVKSKGKKGTRRYEGNEVFKLSRDVICTTHEEGNMVLEALSITQLLLRNPDLPPSILSISSRILLSMLLSLPQLSPASLSPDLSLHGRLERKLQETCAIVGSGTTSIMSKSLGLVIGATIADGKDSAPLTGAGFDILLHPRVPPLLRSLPEVGLLSLFRTEESQEEKDARKVMGLDVIDPQEVEPPVTAAAGENTDIRPPHITPTPTLFRPEPLPVSATPDDQHSAESPVAVAIPADVDPVNNIRGPPASTSAPPPRPSLGGQTNNFAPPISQPPAPLLDVDEEDEEMPAINMDSDSD